MKILIIGPVYPYRGGIAHYTSSLATALGKHQHMVRVLSFKRQYPAFLYPGKSDKDPSLKPLQITAEFLLDPLSPNTWSASLKFIKQFSPDMVVFQWWTTFFGMAFFYLAGKIKKISKVIFLIHNVYPHEPKIWDKLIAKITLKQGYAYIVQSAREQEKLIEIIPNAKFVFCNHPIYQKFSEEVLPLNKARVMANLPQDKIILLFFGIVRPYKGLKNLLEAFSRSDYEKFHLVIAGEFWEKEDIYKSRIDELELNDHITLLNHYISNEEAHILFSSSDILVAPYTGGTQSGVIELSIGYNLPAIVSDTISEGISESTRRNFKVFPANNIQALADTINSVAINRELSNHSNLSPQDDWVKMVSAIEDTAK